MSSFPAGSVRLSAPVGVGSDQDKFGTHYDTLGVGGYRSVADNTALQGIPALRRKKGMLVYKQDNNTIYKYMSADGSFGTNENIVHTDSSQTSGWVPLSFSGGSSLPNNNGLNTGNVYFLKNSYPSSSWSQTWAELTTSDISGLTTALGGKEPSFTILPIIKGGTNSNTDLANNRIMISSGGAIVEASAITGDKVLVSNNNGIPIASGVDAIALAKLNNVPDNTSGDIANKLNITAAAVAGNSSTLNLVFSGTDTIYGSVASRQSGAITTSTIGGKIGVTHIVIHAMGSEPSITAASGGGTLSKLSGSGNYSTTRTNIIFFTCIDANNVIYSINQI